MRAAGATYTAAHVLTAGRLALVLLVQVLFGAACEAAWGATIGKRVFGVRVVALEGARATPLQALIRNALRVIDALPLLYVAGLLAMARSGRTRRQRIGDLAAGTTVMLRATRRPLRTPRWLLPSAVLAAAALSVAAIAMHSVKPVPARVPEERDRPVHERGEAVLEAGEEGDVDDEPGEPAHTPAEAQRADFGHRRGA